MSPRIGKESISDFTRPKAPFVPPVQLLQFYPLLDEAALLMKRQRGCSASGFSCNDPL